MARLEELTQGTSVYDQAEPGTVHVITRTRNEGVNLRTQFERIIQRAGLLPWPRLFQNLRTSRETELAAKFTLHVVTAWIGNSATIAANTICKSPRPTSPRPCSALQNPVQSGANWAVSSGQAQMNRSGKSLVIKLFPLLSFQ